MMFPLNLLERDSASATAGPDTPQAPAPAAPTGPIQEALDIYLDYLAAATVTHPVAHFALVEMKKYADHLAPLVAAALAAHGIKIVKA